MFDNAWLIPVVPLVSAALIAALGRQLPMKGAEIGIVATFLVLVHATAVAVATFTDNVPGGLPVEQAVTWAPLGNDVTLELGMLIDGLTAMMFLLIAIVSFMVHLYSREYMGHEPRFTYFFAMLSLFTASMLILVIANNTVMALVGWELVGVCSYLLIGFYWEDKSNQDAANKAFLTTKSADAGLVVGVIVLFSGAGTFDIVETVERAAAAEIAQGTLVLACLLIFLGAVGKSGQFPLYVWLPDAMAGPTPVSALIHAATMVTAGVFLIARLYPVFAQSLAVMTVIAVIGTITLFVAGLVALVQDDIKRILAYSTVSQLGYMVAALGVGGYTAAIFHLFTHGFFKALLFLGAGSLIHAVHSNNISDMGGLRHSMPTTFWTFIVGSIALAGFPLTAGFFSKDEILVSALSWGTDNGFAVGSAVFTVALLASAITTFYMARACFLIFWGDNRSHVTPHEPGRWMTVPLVVLAVGSLTVGWLGSPLFGEKGFERWTSSVAIEEATYPFVAEEAGHQEGVIGGEGEEHGPEGGESRSAGTSTVATGETPTPAGSEEHGVGRILHGPPEFTAQSAGVGAVALALFAAAVALAWRFYGRGLPERDPMLGMGFVTTALVNKYWLDDLGYRAVVVPVRDRLSRFAYFTNQQWIDRLVAGTGALARHAADVTYGTVDQKIIDGAVNGSAFSAAWWSDRVKRIQSGNVQRYAGAMFAGVIVLVLVFAAA
ncbi:MAG TPA: NADH-quinone oxidoreductase subunit L [Nitriliruptorales bacterium]|nr:NADH-quinone oxidoreductase subunit L [Nitriliruptorales bacterium]